MFSQRVNSDTRQQHTRQATRKRIKFLEDMQAKDQKLVANSEGASPPTTSRLELAPPVVMRHLDRTKEPLPSIGHSSGPTAVSMSPHSQHSGSSESSPQSSKRGGDAAASPDTSTTMVGSLALARRKQRNGGVSPTQTAPGEILQDEAGSERAPKLHSAFLDVLDPDADGTAPLDSSRYRSASSPIVAVSPAVSRPAPTAPQGRLTPLDATVLSATAISRTHYHRLTSVSPTTSTTTTSLSSAAVTTAVI